MTTLDGGLAWRRAALMAALDAIPAMVSLWDRDLVLQFVNRAARESETARLVVGRPLAELVPAESIELLGPYLRAAFDGEPTTYRRQIATLTGSRGTYLVDIAPVYAGDEVVAIRVVGEGLGVDPGAFTRIELTAEREYLGYRLELTVQPRLRAVLAEIATLPRTGGTAAARLQALATEVNDVVIDLRATIAQLRSDEAMVLRPLEPPHMPRRRAGAEPGPAAAAAAPASHEPPDLMQSLFDSLPPTVLWAAGPVAVLANTGARAIFGLDRAADVTGLTYRQLAGPVIADRNQLIISAAIDGVPSATAVEFVDAEGELWTGVLSFAPVEFGGRRYAVGQFLERPVGSGDDDEGDARVAAELEADRRRLAEDLHDHVIQLLYAASLTLDGLVDDPARDVAKGLRDAVLCLTEATLGVHSAVGSLRQARTADADAAVRRAGLRAVGALGFPPAIEITGTVADLPADLVEDLVAVVREALSNVARHAKAGSVRVALSVDGRELRLRVVDDGIGVGEPRRRSGLDNMVSRAQRHGGQMILLRNEPHGTVVDWCVPLGFG